jgi:hypothetical protein
MKAPVLVVADAASNAHPVAITGLSRDRDRHL